ncbi:YjbQ family protein [Candidatus Woesearchaeota archaeon]|nr:YjbQ family protein [Candidatus Woesearchaeota archaeon]
MTVKVIAIRTNKREELVDITHQVEKAVKDVKEGLCTVYCPHTTAGLTINENSDLCVKKDILMALGKIVPDNLNYAHMEGNSHAHIKSSLLGCSLNILIENGKLKLGRWQGILFGEFDGPRNREIYVKILK